MNHHYLETISHGAFSVPSNSSTEALEDSLDRVVQHAHFNDIDLHYMAQDPSSPGGKDSSMMAGPPHHLYSKGFTVSKKKTIGSHRHRTPSKRSSSQSAARDFAKQYLASKRLSGTISTTSSSAFLSNDSFSEDFRGATVGTAKGSSSPTFLSSSSFEEKEDDVSSSKFSVTEMKKMVMESLPAEIRDQVPASAWKRIFSDDDSLVSDQSPLVRRLKGGSKDDVSDIVSVISSIVSRRSGGACEVSTVSGLTRDLFQPSSPRKKPAGKGKLHPKVVSAVPGGLTVIKDDVPTMISTPPSRSKACASSSSPAADRSTGGETVRVSFDKVKVRNYGSVLTVNPAVTTGPAVGLGWEYDSKQDEKYSVEDFERSKRSRPHRISDELIIGREARERLLLNLGYSQKEIAATVRQTIRIKNKRKQTVQNLSLLPMEEILEKATRRLKGVLRVPAVCRRNKSKCNPEFFQKQQTNVAPGAA